MLTYWFLVILTILIGASLLKLTWGKDGVTLDTMPGPRGWPVVGSLPTIGKLPHETFTQMAKTYGNVFKVRLGSRFVVVVHGMRAVRDALLKQAVTFAGRPNFFSMQRMNVYGSNFTVQSYSERWNEQRKMIDSALKNFIDDRPKVMQEKIISEGEELVRILTKDGNGTIIDPHGDLHLSMGNILSFALFNKNYSHDNKKVKDLFSTTRKISEYLTGSGNIDDLLPVFRHFPSRQRDGFDRVMKRELDFVGQQIKEHRQKLKDGNPEDIIDYMLNLRKHGRAIEADIVKKDENIAGMLVSVFAAGFDTMGKTLYVFFLYMILYPEVQDKAQQEIDAVIGRDRPPAFTDRRNLPYVDSLIYELLRHATLAPLSMPHATIKDTKLYDFDIPKDTPVYPNLHSANFDETEWEDPDQFKPERFLSQDGQSLNKVKAAKLASFSFGKRRCPGEQLAQKELFLFITLFLQRFTIGKCPGDNPKLKWNHGLTLHPDRFKILTTPRDPL
ncbi:cytochrome P450 1A1-like [Ptychodera flava]|uniref:cytochrome P450 1A1-like n=1 Tax=Ptychodera flava TaxID=63121 RepID=UPI00396AB0C0